MGSHFPLEGRTASAPRRLVPRLLCMLLVALAFSVIAGSAAADAVVPEHHPPVLSPVGAKVAEEGRILTFALTAVDADGDPLTFSATGLPEGASVDAAAGTFAWTPADGQAGIYRPVTFIVSDGASNDTEEITIACYYAPADVQAPAVIGVPTASPPDEPVDEFWVWASDTDTDAVSSSVEAWYDAGTGGYDDLSASGTDDFSYVDDAGTNDFSYVDDAGTDDVSEVDDNATNDSYEVDDTATDEYDGEDDFGTDEYAREEVDATPATTQSPSLFYANGIGPVAAQQIAGVDAALPSWGAEADGTTKRVMLPLPGVDGSTDQGTTWVMVDPSRMKRMDDGRFVVEQSDMTAVITTDDLSLQDGSLRGRLKTIELDIQPVTAEFPLGEVSSSFTYAGMTIPAPASQAIVALSTQPTRGVQAAYEKVAADEWAEIVSVAAVSTLTIDRMPGMVTAHVTVPLEWVNLYRPETCRILYAGPDGRHAAILPTSVAESEGRVTFTASAFGAGSFALASVLGNNLPELVNETEIPTIGAELPGSYAATAYAADASVKPPQDPGLLWHLLISTGGAFIG